MRRHNAGDEAIEKALSVENSRRCKPRLPQSEITDIARSAVSYDGGEFAQLINLLEVPKLSPAAYHGIAGELVDSVKPYTEAPDAAIIGQALSITGCLAGDGPTVYAGGAQPTRLNVALVGPTSCGRKGTSFSILDSLLRRLPFHPVTDLWKRQCVRGLSTGEGLIKAVADDKKQNEDGESELIEVEKRLFVLEPELSKILAHSKRPGNILSQILRESFDSGHLQTLVVQNPLRADGAHVVVLGHITPEELRSRLTEVDMANGFANRFLWLYVVSDTILPEAGPIPDPLVASLAKKWCRILNDIPDFSQVTRDAEASELWRVVYPSLRTPRAGLRGAILARGETIVTRLALIYALLDRSTKIHHAHVKAALALWQYSVESVGMLFPDKTGDSLADRLYAQMENGPLTKREMYTHFQESADALNSALAELEAAGRVCKSRRRPPGAGRPAEVWDRVDARQIN